MTAWRRLTGSLGAALAAAILAAAILVAGAIGADRAAAVTVVVSFPVRAICISTGCVAPQSAEIVCSESICSLPVDFREVPRPLEVTATADDQPVTYWTIPPGSTRRIIGYPATASSVKFRVEALPGPLSAARSASAGARHTCVLLPAGTSACWGSNASGALGIGRPGGSTERAALVPLQSGFSGVAAGGSHSCAVRRVGTVACWGANGSGQLGDGTRIARTGPVRVRGIVNAVSVAAGGAHSCAVRRVGAVACWGDNADGQLGDGTRDASADLVDVVW